MSKAIIEGPDIEYGKKANRLRWCLKRRTQKETARSININLPQERRYCDNIVVTAKYNAYTAVPQNLYEQFHKLSNVYFLVICILQTIPAITTTNGAPTLAFPLVFVLVANMTKDFYEDWRRHRADRVENQTPTFSVPSSSEPETTKSRLLEYYAMFDIDKGLAAQEEYSGTDTEDETILLGAAVMEQQSLVMGDEFDFGQVQQQSRTVEPSMSFLNTEALISKGLLVAKTWQQVVVGDIIVCRNRDRFPADLVLLTSSDPMGISFIDTASLDGETNLKIRQARNETVELLGNDHTQAFSLVQKGTGRLECGPPDANLNYFDGTVRIGLEGKIDEMKKLPVTANQVVLRGCQLRNTAWIVGLVVYTGTQTKIQMNSSKSPHKVSRIESYTNTLTLIIFVLQVLLCIIGAINTFIIASNETYQKMGYLYLMGSPALQGFTRFFTFLVLLVNMIPISLIVTMGVVKTAQGILIGIDTDMYHSATKTYAAARTSDLNEELGQVEHVFSDKTGTLTCNSMEFRKCCIRGVGYGQGLTEIKINVLRRQGLSAPPNPKPDPNEPITPNVNFVDSDLRRKLQDRDDPGYSDLVDFFVHLAVNQAVVPEHLTGGQIFYSASSPDEGALTYGSSHFGIRFITRDSNGVKLEVLGQPVSIEILGCFEFSSARKRSSVLCHFPNTNAKFNHPAIDRILTSGRYVLYCKGADTVIVERLGGSKISFEDRQSLAIMEDYAKDGLRTLCIARKELEEHIVFEAYNAYESACLALDNRQQKIEEVADSLEKDLELQGVTGIEDKLQDGVNDTIEALQCAGIKVWMLTGDKVETAINIGIATSLIDPSTTQLIYQWDMLEEKISGTSTNAQSPHTTDASPNNDDQSIKGYSIKGYTQPSKAELLASQLTDDLRRLNLTKQNRLNQNRSLKKRFHYFMSTFLLSTLPLEDPNEAEVQKVKASVIIDGDCLSEALKPGLRERFLALCNECVTVLCCRVTPRQKGAVVKMVKELQGSVTLAIGDGANDCNMIQSADVGVGLRGSEGMQAFNVSDYGISQFRFLKVLLLCHGRWCYRRLSRLVLYMFYKNLVIVLPIFYFSFFSLYSGQKIYSEFLIQLYNVILTSMPVVIFGIFDQDVNKQLSLACPQLYRLGQNNFYFNTGVFCRWVCNGVVQSIFVSFLPFLVFSGTKVMNTGLPLTFWFASHVTFLLVMIVVNAKILIESALLNWIMWLAVICSLLAWFLAMSMFSSWPSRAPEIIGLMFSMLQEPLWYIVVLGSPIICLSGDFLWKAVRATFFPELYHLISLAIEDKPEIQEFPAFLVRSSLRGVEKVNFSGPTESPVEEVDPYGRKSDTTSHIETIETKEPSLSRIHRSIPSRGYAFSEADTGTVTIIVPPFRTPNETTKVLFRASSLD